MIKNSFFPLFWSVTGIALGLKVSVLFLAVIPFSFIDGRSVNSGLKREIGILNKQSVKVIKTENGDIFECVDIQKQPALEHPLLKNHIINGSPTSIPKGKMGKAVTHPGIKIGLSGGGCPPGTVPMHRIQKTYLSTSNSPSSFGKQDLKYCFPHNQTENSIGYHWASLRTREGEFYGTQVNMNVWSTKVTDGKQFASAGLWIINGEHEQINVINAGWMVDPGQYGNNIPRLVTQWTRDGFAKTGCYNVDCPGFVQVNRKIPLGIQIQPVSSYNGPQYDLTIMVFKDEETKSWWLTVGKENTFVGYWPDSLFTHLTNNSSLLFWGGAVYALENEGKPPMGSGHFAEEGYSKSCYMRQLMVVNKQNFLQDAPSDTFNDTDAPTCYNVIDGGTAQNYNTRRFFFYGGPGGIC